MGGESKVREESKTIDGIKGEDPMLWDEVAEFMDLLREWGFTSYKLTGPVENPIITTWRITINSRGLS